MTDVTCVSLCAMLIALPLLAVVEAVRRVRAWLARRGERDGSEL